MEAVGCCDVNAVVDVGAGGQQRRPGAAENLHDPGGAFEAEAAYTASGWMEGGFLS